MSLNWNPPRPAGEGSGPTALSCTWWIRAGRAFMPIPLTPRPGTRMRVSMGCPTRAMVNRVESGLTGPPCGSWTLRTSRFTPTIWKRRKESWKGGFWALTDSGISSPFDLASDGTVMWVLDPGGNRIFSYNMPPGLSRTEEPEDTGAFARNRSKEFVGLAEFGLAIPYDIWSDGRTMWGTNGTSTVRAFDLASGARVSARDMDTSGSENAISAGYVWGDEDTLWTWPGFSGIDLRTREAVSTGPLPPSARAPSTGKGIWSDGETFWVSALGYRDRRACHLAVPAGYANSVRQGCSRGHGGIYPRI